MEQATEQQEAITPNDIKLYDILFDALDQSEELQEEYESIADDVMTSIVLLEEKKDRKKDTINFVFAVFFGCLATTIAYIYADLPFLKSALAFVKDYSHVLIFCLIAICFIQFADRLLLRKMR